MKTSDRVTIIGKHPWAGTTGVLGAYGSYGPAILNLKGWLVELDNGESCYANPSNIRVQEGK